MIDKRWLPPTEKGIDPRCVVWRYADQSTIRATSVDLRTIGPVTLYRAAIKRDGRGWVKLSEVPIHLKSSCYGVPNNDWQDAYFRSPEDAAEMLSFLGHGPAKTEIQLESHCVQLRELLEEAESWIASAVKDGTIPNEHDQNVAIEFGVKIRNAISSAR